MSSSSERRSHGTMSVICWPTASFALYPNSRSALWFQLVMVPSSFLLTMASSEESTMAAKSEVVRSACFRSVTSWNVMKDQRIPGSRQSACVKHKRPSTGREFAVDLDSLKFTWARKSCFYGFPDFGGFPFVIPQLADRNALRLIPRNPKYGYRRPGSPSVPAIWRREQPRDRLPY